jgi:hypothetical protein
MFDSRSPVKVEHVLLNSCRYVTFRVKLHTYINSGAEFTFTYQKYFRNQDCGDMEKLFFKVLINLSGCIDCVEA